MKRLCAIAVLTLLLITQTACSANDTANSVEETTPQSSSAPIASEETSASQESSSSLFEAQEVIEEPPEDNIAPWNPDSPFGIAIENASVQLLQVFQDSISMLYSVGLADYNLDRVPELFLGEHGASRGSNYCVFDVTAQEYRFLGSYYVGNSGQRLAIMEDPYSGTRYLKSESEAIAIFDASFVNVFFEPNENSLNIWEHWTVIQTDSRAGEEIKETDKPSEIYFYKHEYALLEDESFGGSDIYQEVEDPVLIEQMKLKWFDKLWLHDLAPIVETEELFSEFDPRLTDPESTKELVYSLAKEYYEKFPEYVNEES